MSKHPSRAEVDWATQLPLEHCNRCECDVPYYAMAMAGLCYKCADYMDELEQDSRDTEQDALRTSHPF